MKYLTNRKITKKFIEKILNKKDEKAGSFIIFTGKVRKDAVVNPGTRGKTYVREIIYEAYNKMAEKEIESIVKFAENKFKVREIIVKHRIGRVKVGEIAFLVAVFSEHRKEGFSAIQFIINKIKKKVPIWKKEILSNGKARWKKGSSYPKTPNFLLP